jgi:hypothetical protein
VGVLQQVDMTRTTSPILHPLDVGTMHHIPALMTMHHRPWTRHLPSMQAPLMLVVETGIIPVLLLPTLLDLYMTINWVAAVAVDGTNQEETMAEPHHRNQEALRPTAASARTITTTKTTTKLVAVVVLEAKETSEPDKSPRQPFRTIYNLVTEALVADVVELCQHGWRKIMKVALSLQPPPNLLEWATTTMAQVVCLHETCRWMHPSKAQDVVVAERCPHGWPNPTTMGLPVRHRRWNHHEVPHLQVLEGKAGMILLVAGGVVAERSPHGWRPSKIITMDSAPN